MSAASNIDADKEALTNFGRYADLAAELRIKIIHAFIANFRKQSPPQRLAPFAALHSEWQHELEPEDELWGDLCLITDDLPVYRSLLNQRRGDSLSKVALWISIDRDAIPPDEQGQDVLSLFDIQSGMRELVVHSVSTLLECVDYAKSTGPQPARQGVELSTQITYPRDMSLGDYMNFEFDFSRLPSTSVVRAFSQKQFGLLKTTGKGVLGNKKILLLNRSSLLSLFSRLPNLEDANIRLHRLDIVPFATTPVVNNCPKLKTLSLSPRIGPTGSGFPGSALSSWVSNFSHNIERLRLGNTNDIARFLSSLSTPSNSTGTITWPNLQVLHITGWHMFGRDDVTEILSAIPAALISLPGIKDITITQKCHLTGIANIVTALKLRSESSKLTVSMGDIFEKQRIDHFLLVTANSSMIYRAPFSFWRVMPDYSATNIASAVADIQAAVSTQHGQVLKVTLPERDVEPESE